jgi:hypothetical protein
MRRRTSSADIVESVVAARGGSAARGGLMGIISRDVPWYAAATWRRNDAPPHHAIIMADEVSRRGSRL